MKTTNQIRGVGYRLVLMSVLTLFAFTGCSAQPDMTNTSDLQSYFQTDSVMRTAIGDSIYKIITEAKKIKAEEIKLTSDTTKTAKEVAIDVKAKYVPLVQFILADPKIYRSNLTTYGSFMPGFKLTFIKKKESCILYFDFGLKKWNVCDNTGKQIKMFDLSSDDMLRFANMLFAKNDLYKNLINTDKR